MEYHANGRWWCVTACDVRQALACQATYCPKFEPMIRPGSVIRKPIWSGPTATCPVTTLYNVVVVSCYINSVVKVVVSGAQILSK